MMKSASPLWLLHYYREAEIRSADLLQRLLRRTDDPQVQMTLTRQLADEARHIQLWTELMSELGGAPSVQRDGYRQRLQHHAGIPATNLDLLALIQVIEERVQQRYAQHATWPEVDPRVVALLQTIAADESWHLAGVTNWLAQQEKKEGKTRVAAALDHYRTREAKAYREVLDKAVGQST
jgi:rubrerythrin